MSRWTVVKLENGQKGFVRFWGRSPGQRLEDDIRRGVKRNPPSGYERFQTYVYGWCEETVIAFAPNPFTARSTPDLLVIRNDDFRFMLKCAIDLFGTHTNPFTAEVEPEHGV